MSTKNSLILNQSYFSNFGQRLKAVFGKAQNKEIAALLGVSNPAVSSYLRGRIPPAEKLVEIAGITGCNLHWLLTGEGPTQVIEDQEQAFGSAKTLLFHCSKGGVGTSITALLTAVELANQGYKTLLIDNWFGSCTHGLFYQVIENHKKDKPSRRRRQDFVIPNEFDGRMVFNTPIRGLDLVSYKAEHQAILWRERIRSFDLMPERVQKDYSFVVFDGHSHTNPFHPTELFKAPLLRDAKVFIPYEPYNADATSIKTTLKYVKFAQSFYLGIEFVGLFISNYEPAPPISVALRREIDSLSGGKVFRSIIHRSPELWDLITEGVATFYQKKSKVVREFGRLVTEIQEKLGDAKQERGRSRRIS
ncbi:MAG TPA: helix-turn-helix domain-containing protein [Nitrososphaera sp.]|jgi:cellulose biosynthesis protein BcsQ|nr:helix-turn-helix domain-containing protein [Nitrososphaera sp.]